MVADGTRDRKGISKGRGHGTKRTEEGDDYTEINPKGYVPSRCQPSSSGTEAREPQDYGFMYGRSFNDLDGHIWEIIWMDPSHIQRS